MVSSLIICVLFEVGLAVIIVIVIVVVVGGKTGKIHGWIGR